MEIIFEETQKTKKSQTRKKLIIILEKQSGLFMMTFGFTIFGLFKFKINSYKVESVIILYKNKNKTTVHALEHKSQNCDKLMKKCRYSG